MNSSFRVAGLFAGIGGIELGLEGAGWSSNLLCEMDPGARRVLRARFPQVDLVDDVTALDHLPECDLLAAGFPCQDLSQAGRTAGIRGARSGLVDEVFRLLDQARPAPTWLLLENVPFMLSLDRGAAMSWLVEQLERRGFKWAYRVVDSRGFGLPQRRQRVLLLASKDADPRSVLLNEDDESSFKEPTDDSLPCGFYWTEGLRGLGWAIDAVPTLKGGSTVGIPSPPAIWFPVSGHIGTPGIRDAERLQGFSADWTAPSVGEGFRQNDRWRLVGNAVSVPVARWLGKRLLTSDVFVDRARRPLTPGERWPRAAWGGASGRFAVPASPFPRVSPRPHLTDFLSAPTTPLSARATAGFLDRARRGNLRISGRFLHDAERHLEGMNSQLPLMVA